MLSAAVSARRRQEGAEALGQGADRVGVRRGQVLARGQQGAAQGRGLPLGQGEEGEQVGGVGVGPAAAPAVIGRGGRPGSRRGGRGRQRPCGGRRRTGGTRRRRWGSARCGSGCQSSRGARSGTRDSRSKSRAVARWPRCSTGGRLFPVTCLSVRWAVPGRPLKPSMPPKTVPSLPLLLREDVRRPEPSHCF